MADRALLVRAIGMARTYLPSVVQLRNTPELAAVLQLLDECKRDIEDGRRVVFTLPRAGWVSFGFDGEEPAAYRCDHAAARLAHAVFTLPTGSGIVLDKPDSLRNSREAFASFLDDKGPAGRALAQSVRCIVVSAKTRTAHHCPRPGAPIVLAR